MNFVLNLSSVDQEEIKHRTSAEMKLFYGIFLPVCHRLLRIKLDATECVSFISDLDASIPLSSEYFNSIARALLPFMETEEGTLATRILMESTSSIHIESFFNALVLQLSSLPHGISGSVPVQLGSECALADLCGSHLASIQFKNSRSIQPHHGGSTQRVFIEVQLGSAKPSTHVIFNSIGRLPPSLNMSISWDKQGLFVFVDSVPVCIINATMDNLIFSKVVCSVPIRYNSNNFKSSFGGAPDWMVMFLKSKLQQSALESTPITESPISSILKYSERLSILAEKTFPAVTWSSFLQRAIISELVSTSLIRGYFFFIFTHEHEQIDVNNESASRDLICSAVNSFLDACEPFLSSSTSGLNLQEQTPRSCTAAEGSLLKQFPASSGNQIENSSDLSPLTKAYMRFAHSMCLASSNFENSFCASTVPVDLQFRSIVGSKLASDQHASNSVQIVLKPDPKTGVSPPSFGGFGSNSGFESGNKTPRKISSLPISLATFSARICVKDLDFNDVAFVELIIYTPDSNTSNRFVFYFQLRLALCFCRHHQ
jgi:hypothetical protein